MITFSFICSVGKRSISKTDSCVDRPVLALSSAYQEFLVALNWWRHRWHKEHDQLYTHICVVNTLRVKVPNEKHLKKQTIELARALLQDRKVLCDFTRLVSMLFSHMIADYRSFVLLHTLMYVSACKADIICITQITLKEIYNVLLVDNWRFRFLRF